MKKNYLFSIISILAGLLLIILPKTIAKPCSHEGACVHSTAAVLAIAVVITLLGFTALLAEGKKQTVGNHILGFVLAAFVILIPTVLIGGCKMQDMACRKKTFPVFYVIGAVYALLTVISLIIRLVGSSEENKEK